MAALMLSGCSSSSASTKTLPSRTPARCSEVDTGAFRAHPDAPRFEALAYLARQYVKMSKTGYFLSSGIVDGAALRVVRDPVLACQRIPTVGSGAHLAVTLSSKAAQMVMYSSWLPYYTASVSEKAVLQGSYSLQQLRKAVGGSRPGTIDDWSVAHMAVRHRKAAILALGSHAMASQAPPRSEGVWAGFSVAHMAVLLHADAALMALRDPYIRRLTSVGFGGLSVAHLAVMYRSAAGYALQHPQIYSLRAGVFLGWEGLTVAHFIAVFHASDMVRWLRRHPSAGHLAAKNMKNRSKLLSVTQTATYFSTHDDDSGWAWDVM